MTKKGDLVLVKKEVRGSSESNKRILYFPWFVPIKGIVIGYSFIQTGDIKMSHRYENAWLSNVVSHKVWVIEPIGDGKRYLKSIRALETDIEPIKEIQ